MKVYIPEKLDVGRMLEKVPPTNIPDFNKNKLLYIIGSLTYMQTYRDDQNIGGYWPLSSTALQRKAGIRHYNRYLKYLVSVGVFASINYVKGEHARLYKLRPPYDGATRTVTLTEDRFVKSFKERDTHKADSINQYKNLWQWFKTGNLQIDKEKAFELLHEKYPLSMSAGQTSVFQGEDYWPEDDLSAKHHRLARIIENIHSGDPEKLHFTVDETVGRLHTVLTNLNRDFRNFLTYGGKQLASIDVKCCQPYLTLLLFNLNFYKFNVKHFPKAERQALNNLMKDMDARQISLSYSSCSSSVREHLLSLRSVNDSEKGLASVFSSSVSLSSSIMLVKDIQEGIEKGLCKDVVQYMHDILVKDFYTELSTAFNMEYGTSHTRDDVKELWSIVAFGKVRVVNHVSTPNFYRFFAKRYPTVLKLYDVIKMEQYQNMAHLLQQVEAHIVLKVISKRITRLKPRVPLYSIHDSLVTTVDHVEFVRSVMEEELQRMVGERPKLKVETWSPEANAGIAEDG